MTGDVQTESTAMDGARQGRGSTRKLGALPRSFSILVVDGGSGGSRALGEGLQVHGVAVRYAGDCCEASQALSEPHPPQLVFTDARLRDGSWRAIIEVASKASYSIKVVVVSRVGSIDLYKEAMFGGAFDFITPNTEASQIVELVLDAANPR